MRLFTGRARLLTFSFRWFPVKQHLLPASNPRFFDASDKGTPLILLLDTHRSGYATVFPIPCNNGNTPLATRLNSPPTPYPLCIIVAEHTGIPLLLCKHATYWAHVGKDTSAIFLFKV